MRLAFGFILILFSFSCLAQNNVSVSERNDMDVLTQLMTGTFSSAEQAKADSSYFDISLVMQEVWEGDNEHSWLYVEQAVSAYPDKPYRQRVYRIHQIDENQFESRVFTLKNPEKYIHAWQKPELFESINSDSLQLRSGCSVYLTKNDDGCFTGSTKDKACASTLRGASYATSIVTICPDNIISWDQGWDDEDNQVWGAEKAGYIFKRKKN